MTHRTFFPSFRSLQYLSRLSGRDRRRLLTGTVASLVVSLTFQSLASTNSFTGSNTSTWNDLSNWSLGHVPDSTDALLLLGSTNSELNSDFTAQTLSFDLGAAGLNIDANTSGTTARTLTLTGGANNANGGTELISLSNNLDGPVTLGRTAGVGTLTVAFGGNTGTISIYRTDATLIFSSSSIITGSNGLTLTSNNQGTVVLAGTNAYTGVTTIAGGTLSLPTLPNGGGSIGASPNAASNVLINGGTLQYTGTGQSTDLLFTYAGGALDASGTGTVTFTSPITFSGTNTTHTLNLIGTGSGTLTAPIGDNGTGKTSVTKSGTGTWALAGANTYTGVTTINGGVLSVSILANGGVASGLGSATALAANLVINGGTLRYTGSGSSTNRRFTIGLNGATLDASGTGTMSFTSTGSLTFSGTINQTFGLTGSGSGVLAGAIIDPASAQTSVTKNGTGTWSLTNASSSYTGITTVNAGTLSVATLANGGTASPIGFSSNAASNLVLNGGTLLVAGSAATDRLFTINGAVAIDAESVLQFVNTGSLSVSSGSLTLTGSGIGIMTPILGGSASLTKTGIGTWGFGSAQTYTGNTNVNAGTLEFLGTNFLPSTSNVNVQGGSLSFGSFNNVVNNLTLTSGNIAGTGVLSSSNTFNLASGTVSVNLGGTGGVSKTTTGTVTLSGANTNTGATIVNSGNLVVSGSLSGTTSVTVGDGTNPATLSGSGTITPANGHSVTVKNGAKLAPDSGTSNGLTLNAAAAGAASLNLQSGSTLQLAITNSLGDSYGAPSLNDYSKLTLGPGVTATLSGLLATAVTGTVNQGDVYVILFSDTAVSGLFSNTGPAAPGSAGSTYLFTSGGQQWEINYAWTGSAPLNGMDLTSFAQATGGTNVALLAIPEPGSLTTLLAGSALLLFRRRRPAAERQTL